VTSVCIARGRLERLLFGFSRLERPKATHDLDVQSGALFGTTAVSAAAAGVCCWICWDYWRWDGDGVWAWRACSYWLGFLVVERSVF
jgi:hypothetical protein